MKDELEMLNVSNLVNEPTEMTRDEYMKILAEYNDISPRQLREVLDSTEDEDDGEVENELMKQRKHPDVEYLIRKYRSEDADVDIVADNELCERVLQALQYGDCVGTAFTNVAHSQVKTSDLNPFYTLGTGYTEQAKAVVKEYREHSFRPHYAEALKQKYRENPKAGYSYKFARWAAEDELSGYHDVFPDCLTRVTGLALLIPNYEKMLRNAVQCCITTHNYTESVKAVIVWCTILRYAYLYPFEYAQFKIETYLKHCYGYDDLTPERYEHSYRLGGWYPYDEAIDAHQPDEEEFVTGYVGYDVCMVIDHFVKAKSKAESLMNLLGAFGNLDGLCALESALWAVVGFKNQ